MRVAMLEVAHHTSATDGAVTEVQTELVGARAVVAHLTAANLQLQADVQRLQTQLALASAAAAAPQTQQVVPATTATTAVAATTTATAPSASAAASQPPLYSSVPASGDGDAGASAGAAAPSHGVPVSGTRAVVPPMLPSVGVSPGGYRRGASGQAGGGGGGVPLQQHLQRGRFFSSSPPPSPAFSDDLGPASPLPSALKAMGLGFAFPAATAGDNGSGSRDDDTGVGGPVPFSLGAGVLSDISVIVTRVWIEWLFCERVFVSTVVCK